MAVDIAQAYSDAFAPELFVLFCTLLLLGYERRITRPAIESRRPSSRWGLLARLGVVAGAWTLAFAIYQSVPLVFEQTPQWGDDLFGGLGLAAGFACIGLVWRYRRWGRLLPEFAALLIAVTVVHSVVTPFWDVSSHVLYAATPAGYLGAVTTEWGATQRLDNRYTWPRIRVQGGWTLEKFAGVLEGLRQQAPEE